MKKIHYLAAFLVLAITMPSLVFAQVEYPRVTVTGNKIDNARRDFEQEYNEAMMNLEWNWRGAYNGRQQWNQFLPSTDTNDIIVASTDTRCNPVAKTVAGGTTASSLPSAQKGAAEAVVNAITAQMGGPAAFNAMVDKFPKQSGRNVNDGSFTAAPIMTIIWQDGTSTNFQMSKNGSGNWVVTAPVSTEAKPSWESTQCPGPV